MIFKTENIIRKLLHNKKFMFIHSLRYDNPMPIDFFTYKKYYITKTSVKFGWLVIYNGDSLIYSFKTNQLISFDVIEL